EASAECDLATQQASLDVWRQTFNEERPHEALGMQVPQVVYQDSPRAFDPTPVELIYPAHHLVRKVSLSGNVSLHNVQVSISAALCGWEVGLEAIAPGQYAVCFCRLRLVELDLHTEKFTAANRNSSCDSATTAEPEMDEPPA